MVADDPGGFSLRAAIRAILSFLASGGLLLAIHASSTSALIGASMAMMVNVSVGDPQPKAQAVTIALGIAAADATICLAALVSSSPHASSVLLCSIVFVSVLLRARGPRGMAVGMLGFMGCFYALFVAATPEQIPALAGSVAAGGVAALVIRFVVVREHASRVHAHVLRAFRARVQLLLDDLAHELESGESSDRRLRRIRRQTGRINEIALALEQAAGRSMDRPPVDAARPWLIELLETEIAIDTLAEAAHRIAGREWMIERRRALAATVRALQRWIAERADGARAEVARLLAVTTREPQEAGSASEPAMELMERRRRVWARVERAVARLLDSTPWQTLPTFSTTGNEISVMAFRSGGGGTAGMTGHWPNLRLAIQTTIAVAVAIIIGRTISAERWYWAVLATFVVFVRATTVGETLSRAWQRFFGTVLGVAAGTLIAELLRRHTTVATVVALAALFVAYILLRVAYSGMILFVTVALALLYEMMGRPVPGLMELRLAETAAGAAVGVVVASIIFPMHTAPRVRRLVAVILREAANVLERAMASASDPRRRFEMHDAIRRVDQALAEVRNVVRPFWAPHVPWEPTRLVAQGRNAAALAYTIRRAMMDIPILDGTRDADTLRNITSDLAQNCRAVADTMEFGAERALVVVAPRIEAFENAVTEDPQLAAAASLCADIDSSVRRFIEPAHSAAPRPSAATRRSDRSRSAA